MNIKPLKKSYLNISGSLYDCDFINLANIHKNKIAFDDNTIFLTEEKKEKLNGEAIKLFNQAIYVFKRKEIYGVVCDIDISEYKNDNIKCHELVIPEKIQGMMNNYHGYNSETAPVLLGHEYIIDYQKYIQHNSYSYHYSVNDWEIYVLENEACKELLQELQLIKTLYVADGHHRLYTSSFLDFKSTILACLIDFRFLEIKPIHRILKDISNERFENAYRFIDKHFKTTTIESSIVKGRVKFHRLNQSIAVDLIDLNGDSFWNNDIYRLNTQVLSQAFRIYDHSSIEYLSPYELESRIESLKEDEVLVETYEVTLDDFIICADRGCIMPPKSTWFSPKFPSFLIFKKYK